LIGNNGSDFGQLYRLIRIRPYHQRTRVHFDSMPSGSAWCREHGVYPPELETWKQDAIGGIGENGDQY
jgi:hypothetical protein